MQEKEQKKLPAQGVSQAKHRGQKEDRPWGAIPPSPPLGQGQRPLMVIDQGPEGPSEVGKEGEK